MRADFFLLIALDGVAGVCSPMRKPNVLLSFRCCVCTFVVASSSSSIPRLLKSPFAFDFDSSRSKYQSLSSTGACSRIRSVSKLLVVLQKLFVLPPDLLTIFDRF